MVIWNTVRITLDAVITGPDIEKGQVLVVGVQNEIFVCLHQLLKGSRVHLVAGICLIIMIIATATTEPE
jgi:hypothetical protein